MQESFFGAEPQSAKDYHPIGKVTRPHHTFQYAYIPQEQERVKDAVEIRNEVAIVTGYNLMVFYHPELVQQAKSHEQLFQQFTDVVEDPTRNVDYREAREKEVQLTRFFLAHPEVHLPDSAAFIGPNDLFLPFDHQKTVHRRLREANGDHPLLCVDKASDREFTYDSFSEGNRAKQFVNYPIARMQANFRRVPAQVTLNAGETDVYLRDYGWWHLDATPPPFNLACRNLIVQTDIAVPFNAACQNLILLSGTIGERVKIVVGNMPIKARWGRLVSTHRFAHAQILKGHLPSSRQFPSALDKITFSVNTRNVGNTLKSFCFPEPNMRQRYISEVGKGKISRIIRELEKNTIRYEKSGVSVDKWLPKW